MSKTGTMKIAFAYWENRIAPVFDTAQQIYAVKAESGQIVSEAQKMPPGDFPVRMERQNSKRRFVPSTAGRYRRGNHSLRGIDQRGQHVDGHSGKQRL
jgi:hypothetical protein